MKLEPIHHQRRREGEAHLMRHRRQGEREFVLHHRRSDPRVWKGAAAGLLGGLAGAWSMNQFQAAWSKLAKPGEQANGGEQQPSEAEPATVKAAEKISENLIHRNLTADEKKKAEPIVHYGFGAIVGAVYGGVAEALPAVRKGAGLPFGTAVFVGADEVAVPKLGLSKPAAEYPLSVHAQALASHLVYGLTTEMVRRALRWAL